MSLRKQDVNIVNSYTNSALLHAPEALSLMVDTAHSLQISLDIPEVPAVAPARRLRRMPLLIRAAGRSFPTSEVFDTYWRFAAARQAVYLARLQGRMPGPWTTDPILRDHRFTNCFRASDRVSQYCIRQVAYEGPQEPTSIAFRILLFKMFNKIDTWRLLTERLGTIDPESFDFQAADRLLTEESAQGRRLYSAAYVVPPPRMGAVRKHSNHLLLLKMMMAEGLPARLFDAQSMATAFEILKSYPAMGDFLAFQFLIDVNYSAALNFDEMDFVVAGPGARDGLLKCFGPAGKGYERELIRYMADSQEEHFDRLGLDFPGLFGRRLQLIDCQNLFCEVDKYSRVAHPHIQGHSGRSRIKQRFTPVTTPTPAWFPPKWGINDAVSQFVTRVASA